MNLTTDRLFVFFVLSMVWLLAQVGTTVIGLDAGASENLILAAFIFNSGTTLGLGLLFCLGVLFSEV